MNPYTDSVQIEVRASGAAVAADLGALRPRGQAIVWSALRPQKLIAEAEVTAFHKSGVRVHSFGEHRDVLRCFVLEELRFDEGGPHWPRGQSLHQFFPHSLGSGVLLPVVTRSIVAIFSISSDLLAFLQAQSGPLCADKPLQVDVALYLFGMRA